MLDFERQDEYLVGVDSDGCAFDTMELKHKECFVPHTINFYELQGVSKYAREAAEFVNLYSKSRGTNRFLALVETLEWLRRRPEVQARGVNVAIPQGLVAWMKRENKLGNSALKKAVDATGDPDLKKALAWSEAVNRAVEGMVRGVPPFPFVRESLAKACPRADVLVVSATPQEALRREWQEHDLTHLVALICGQESGTKREFLNTASLYGPDRALMIGDAPGDYEAAKANRALFFPINPGAEEASWKRFHEEGIERFFAGTFAGAYQESLLAEFDRCLPARPPWKVNGET
jgi:phosphoglycolate phosphatase-like HAD superfamily hydrolase